MARPKTEILYGFHPVCEALRANRRALHAVLVRRGRQGGRMATLRQLAGPQNIRIETVDESRLTELTGHDEHQGICARVAPLPFSDLPDVVGAAEGAGRKAFFVLLDNVQDPRNLGAIIRTAYCAGVDGLVIPRDRSAGPTPLVSKASAGALEHLPIIRVANLVQAVQQLQKMGLWIVGLEGGADQSLYACDLKMPLGLIVGGEEKGLRPLVKRQCDFLVSIPHARVFNSLNASVAAALAIFEARRQRLPAEQTTGGGGA